MLHLNSSRRVTIAGFAVMFLITLCVVFLTSCSQEKQEPPKPRARPTGESISQKTTSKSQIDIHQAIAVIETDEGTMEVEFFADVAPKTVENFIKKARLEYYNNGEFHRVEPGKLIQAGARFAIDETIPIEPSDYKPVRGIVAMAKAEGATVADAAQFFICLDTLELDSDYTMFGKVTKGLDVIDKIEQGDKITKITLREKG